MYSDQDRARDWLQDIIEECDAISDHVAGLDFEGFVRSRIARDAVERCLERVTEAAVRLGADRFEKIVPGLPLHKVRGLGNFLRHAYDEVDPMLIWSTAKDDLPALRAACERALAGG